MKSKQLNQVKSAPKSSAPVVPISSIKLRMIRHSARKLNPYADNLRNKLLSTALEMSKIGQNQSSRFYYKALLMAQADAKQKKMDTDNVFISQIYAMQGPKLKRSRPNARGRSNRYQKHLAHIFIETSQRLNESTITETNDVSKTVSVKDTNTETSSSLDTVKNGTES